MIFETYYLVAVVMLLSATIRKSAMQLVADPELLWTLKTKALMPRVAALPCARADPVQALARQHKLEISDVRRCGRARVDQAQDPHKRTQRKYGFGSSAPRQLVYPTSSGRRRFIPGMR